jgi:hypothetical protein
MMKVIVSTIRMRAARIARAESRLAIFPARDVREATRLQIAETAITQ